MHSEGPKTGKSERDYMRAISLSKSAMDASKTNQTFVFETTALCCSCFFQCQVSILFVLSRGVSSLNTICATTQSQRKQGCTLRAGCNVIRFNLELEACPTNSLTVARRRSAPMNRIHLRQTPVQCFFLRQVIQHPIFCLFRSMLREVLLQVKI